MLAGRFISSHHIHHLLSSTLGNCDDTCLSNLPAMCCLCSSLYLVDSIQSGLLTLVWLVPSRDGRTTRFGYHAFDSPPTASVLRPLGLLSFFDGLLLIDTVSIQQVHKYWLIEGTRTNYRKTIQQIFLEITGKPEATSMLR